MQVRTEESDKSAECHIASTTRLDEENGSSHSQAWQGAVDSACNHKLGSTEESEVLLSEIEACLGGEIGLDDVGRVNRIFGDSATELLQSCVVVIVAMLKEAVVLVMSEWIAENNRSIFGYVATLMREGKASGVVAGDIVRFEELKGALVTTADWAVFPKIFKRSFLGKKRSGMLACVEREKQGVDALGWWPICS